MGDKFDDTKRTALKPGRFAQTAKGVKHYAWASQETIIQLHGIGPQNLIYINEADDPRKKVTQRILPGGCPCSQGSRDLRETLMASAPPGIVQRAVSAQVPFGGGSTQQQLHRASAQA